MVENSFFIVVLIQSKWGKWKHVPSFYKDKLKSYFDLTDLDNQSPYNQCIWNNRHICINQKSYFNKQSSNCGLNLVSDLFHANGDIIPLIWHEKDIPNKDHLLIKLIWFQIFGSIF